MLKDKLKLSLLIIIEIIFCFSPIGSIPIGPIVATTCMIPVVIISLTFGKKYGMLAGLVFAICGLIYWTFIMPAFPTAFLFTPFSEFSTYKGNFGSLLICFVPRILGGIVPAFIMSKKNINSMWINIASACGSLTNTLFTVGLIFICFRNEYATVEGKNIFYLLSITILTNGIPEALLCAISCPVVVKILKKI